MSNSSPTFWNKDQLVEIIRGRFYFLTINRFFPQKLSQTIYITADDSSYPYIQSYFGPPCISDVYKYCVALQYLLKENNKKVVHWSSYSDLEKYTNALFLVGAFITIYYKKDPKEVAQLVERIGKGRIIPFRDTTRMKNEPTLGMLYFFQGLQKAMKLDWFNMNTFDSNAYDSLSEFKGGDMNWIVPGKILALSCPLMFVNNPQLYIDYFKRKNVVALVQLNAATYDKNIFRNKGIRHYDLQFEDGGVPNKAITKRFLAIIECTHGAIAVHCRAGLGRTGTLIGCYIIKKFDMSALETTAWIRLCRPGSVIGLQQRFLMSNEGWLKSYSIECDKNALREWSMPFDMLLD